MSISEELQKIKEPYLKTIYVLDKGFVRLVDFMGDDARIVQAARVSYGAGTKTVREDKGLIDYLMRHWHTSPFEQVQFTFHVKLPVFVARQLVRHRTASLNEISGRYSVMTDEFYVPSLSRMQKQSADNKQGSSPELIPNNLPVMLKMRDEQKMVYDNYLEYLEEGLAKELARINLPLSTYTEWYWSMDAKNLFHFLKLRMDSHAQWEIQEFARAKYELIKPIIPYACESFEKHMLNSKTFSSDEMELLKAFADLEGLAEGAKARGWTQSKINEFFTKI